MPKSKRLALTGVTATVLMMTVLAACTPANPVSGRSADQPRGSASTGQASSGPRSPASSQVAPVALSSNVKDGASSVKVDTLVWAKAVAGTLSKVQLSYAYTDRTGAKRKGTVDGEISKDQARWTASQRLEPGAAYKLTVLGRDSAGLPSTENTAFTTEDLSLGQQTFASVYPLKGSKVGVGMPVVVKFDVPVKNRAEFEKNLHVISSPAQRGSWHWYSGTQVRFRPENYWKPGTEVSVNADLNGLNAGGGIYGQSSASTSFTVDRSMITKVDLATDVATVYQDGKKVRTIYVSGGKPGWQTRSGTKLIMGKEYEKTMTNEMIGAKEDYSLTAKYALRITNSGEFLHSAPWNAGNFGRRNASHGCVGMSVADSGWLYERALVGDPVVTTGSARQMELGNGYGDWNVSYQTYAKGSAV